jgi:hypothetical protein
LRRAGLLGVVILAAEAAAQARHHDFGYEGHSD